VNYFYALAPNYEEMTYEINTRENPLNAKHNSIIHLLIALGVLLMKANTVSVDQVCIYRQMATCNQQWYV